MKNDSRGFAISLDLLLALIPITIIMGMAAANMDNMMYMMEDTVFQTSLERVGADTVDTLVETSGDPPNWEQTMDVNIAGLAKYDVNKKVPNQNYLFAPKVIRLNETLISDLTGPEYNSYLRISRVSDNSTVKTVGTLNTTAPNVVRIERLVVTTNLEIVASLEGLLRGTATPRTHSTVFPTNDVYVESYDYWVLVINRGYASSTIDVNNNWVVAPNDFPATEVKKLIDPTFMYSQPQFLDNIVNVRNPAEPGSSMDVYVISAPKGTPESEINLDTATPQKCRLEFYIWIR